MRVLRFVLVLFIAFIFSLMVADKPLYAAENNIFGIHITDKEDIPLAATLVNGETGEWGYVTLVIQADDRSFDKWQPIFYDLMTYKLIPIVRIAGKVDGNVWTRPTESDAQSWADFLDSLYWPTKKRIVSIYNEPNHGREWGGTADPADYARVLSTTIEALKKKNADFFVLNAGFDASTPQEPPDYYELGRYLQEMEQAVPGIFNKLDGWASHSYPNPGFSGKVTDSGKGTIRGYQWELDFLRERLNVTKNLPVYIKETGWPYRTTERPTLRTSEELAAANIVQAFQTVWSQDPQVVAVTPFLLRYRGSAFVHFSWLDLANQPTELYRAVAELPKTKGDPERALLSSITKVDIPSTILEGIESSGSVVMKNIGNRPWLKQSNVYLGQTDDFQLVVRNNFELEDTTKIMPGQSFTFRFNLKGQELSDRAMLMLSMRQDQTTFGERLLVPIKVRKQTRLIIKLTSTAGQLPSQVSYGVANSVGLREIYSDRSVNSDGTIETFQHPLLIPDELTNIVVAAPRRDRVSVLQTITEGDNLIEIQLPEEKNMLTMFVDRVSQLIRRPE